MKTSDWICRHEKNDTLPVVHDKKMKGTILAESKDPAGRGWLIVIEENNLSHQILRLRSE
jgi:hypothetical protein